MIKRTILSMAIFISSVIVHGQESDNSTKGQSQTGVRLLNVPLYCGDVKTMIDRTKAHNEELVFMGGLTNGFNTFMSVNHKTGTYTILIVNKNKNFACLAAAGKGFQNFFSGPKI